MTPTRTSHPYMAPVCAAPAPSTAGPDPLSNTPSVASRIPLAYARGSKTFILSRDRKGAVVKNYAGRHTRYGGIRAPNLGFPRREFLAALAAAGLLSGAPARIRVGCQTRTYGSPIRDRAKLLSVLEDLKSAGYEGFETNFASLEHSFADPAPMRAEIDRRGVPLIALHLGAALWSPASLEKERAQIERVSAAVKALGGTHLMLSGRALPKEGAQEALARKAAELQRTGAELAARGLRLCLHNHFQELARDAEELRFVLAHTQPDAVSLVLDVSYLHIAGLDIPEFIRRHGRRIGAFHIRDMKGKREAQMGEGDIDFRAMAKALRDTGWTGWAIFEMNPLTDVPSRTMVGNARKYMKDVMQL
ncbi:MAG: TIM barrel protein [Acidobacteria bacterium]|nr:TIM barrel protein [Acidobacteriota bacterium]